MNITLLSDNLNVKGCPDTEKLDGASLPVEIKNAGDLVMATTDDGIIIADKKSAEKFSYDGEKREMYERRLWGEYRVLDYTVTEDGSNSLTKHLTLDAGKHISYQRHSHRTEMWTFANGEGKLILDGVVTKVKRGDIAYIKSGMMHAVKADTELHIIEVQIGDKLIEEDIERFDYDFDSLDK